MKIIGIAGGVAAGKSLISDRLRQLGAELLDADQVGHEVLEEPQIKEAIRHRWGSAVFDEGGHVVRRALAAIVFAPGLEGRMQLDHLEQITHPRIGERITQQLAQMAGGADPPSAVVLDAPLMFKAGWDSHCDTILFVEAPRELREARATARGWKEGEFARRESAQGDLEEKRRRSDLTIDNTGTIENTHRQVDRFWRSLIDSAPPG